ncbi:MAG: potassium/proton antiporter [Gemmatimonadaceae bacterium]
MAIPEPISTAVLFTVLAVLIGVSVLFSRASERAGIPLTLIFLLIGMLAGSEGIGGIEFEDYRFAFRVGSAALVFILFDAGLNTPHSVVRQAARPAAVLSTFGVLWTAILVAMAANFLGLEWPAALLLGAIVSSTDAAAVFSVLRGSGLHLKRRVGGTLEVESGINDPMAVILTTILTHNLLASGGGLGWGMLIEILRQIVLGGLLGFFTGYGGRWLLGRYPLPALGLYPALTMALALFAFGAPTLIGGSGFLAVYVAAVVLGNGPLPNRSGTLRVHDSMAWLSQITMFLMLGLLVFPSRLVEVAWVGIGLALFLAVIARPVVVALCLAPFSFALREIVYIGWVGLRGAVPIILATFPVLAGAPGAERIFDIVFFIVVANALIPGTTVPWLTRRLGLESREPPAPRAVLEIQSMQPLKGKLMSFYIDEALAVAGVPISELPFPEGSAATLIIRGQELVAAKGGVSLLPGDHVYVFAREEDEPFLQLMFGRPEGDE